MKSDQTALATGEGQCIIVRDLFSNGWEEQSSQSVFDGNLLKTFGSSISWSVTLPSSTLDTSDGAGTEQAGG